MLKQNFKKFVHPSSKHIAEMSAQDSVLLSYGDRTERFHHFCLVLSSGKIRLRCTAEQNRMISKFLFCPAEWQDEKSCPYAHLWHIIKKKTKKKALQDIEFNFSQDKNQNIKALIKQRKFT